MRYYLATVLLLPILFIQGFYVRRTALRLPEPEGPRNGCSGAGPRLKLLIAGDSATAGVGVKTQDEALTGQLVSRLADDYEVCYKLLAETGDTSADVLEWLHTEPQEHFDVAMISVGVNDVTGRTPKKQWLANLRGLITVARERYGAREVLLSSVPPMHLFPALPQPLRWWVGERARMLNQWLEDVAARDGQCTVVTPSFPLEPGFMAEDGFHPGAAAYRVWAEQSSEIIRFQFSQDTIASRKD